MSQAMAPKKPTIYDVAEISGVSISTISRVLNSPEKVNSKTRERVMSAIDELSFVPRAEARARAMRNTNRIGVLTPFFTAPSFVQRLRGVAGALSRANCELVIYTVDSVEHLQAHIASIPIMQNLDGLIIMSLAIEEADARRLHDNGIETVLIESWNAQLNCICIDDPYGGMLAAKHLIDRGHTRIGFLGDIEPPERYAIRPVKSRLAGFKRALEEAGLPLPRRYIVRAPYTKAGSQQAARELLTLPRPPTAIFATSDIQAVGIMKVARLAQLRIPEDLAIVGFDDIDLAEFMDLTTIRQNLDESGRLAAEILLSKMAEPDRSLQHITLPLTLIERQTA
jgi:LacI family transcriptional regulator, galactose operon repressor